MIDKWLFIFIVRDCWKIMSAIFWPFLPPPPSVSRCQPIKQPPNYVSISCQTPPPWTKFQNDIHFFFEEPPFTVHLLLLKYWDMSQISWLLIYGQLFTYFKLFDMEWSVNVCKKIIYSFDMREIWVIVDYWFKLYQIGNILNWCFVGI